MADKKITLQTAKKIVPMIYAYTTPEIKRHDGWTKIGYTEQDVDKRLGQQTHTADVEYHEEWRGTADLRRRFRRYIQGHGLPCVSSQERR